MLRRLTGVLVATSGLLCIACGPVGVSDEPSLTVVHRDSAGVQIVESTAPAWDASDAWGVDTVPVVTIGSPGEMTVSSTEYLGISGAEIPLERVQSAKFLSDGRIVVADAGASRMMVFDSLGTLTGRFGGPGQGPGETSLILGAQKCAGDSIVVVSRRQVLVFDAEGHFARQARYRGGFVGISSDCGRIMVDRLGAVPPLGELGFRESAFSWLDPADASEDEVANVGLVEVWTRLLYGAARPSILPWGTVRTTYAVDDDRLVVGYGRDPELRSYDATGSLRSVVRWSPDPHPITREDRQRYSRYRSDWRVDMPPDEPEVDFLFPTLDEFPALPSRKPIFDKVLIDDEGAVWIRNVPAESLGAFDSRIPDVVISPKQTWTVFGTSGVWLGDLILPLRFDLMAVAQSKLLGVATGLLDVQTVKVFRIVRPT